MKDELDEGIIKKIATLRVKKYSYLTQNESKDKK